MDTHDNPDSAPLNLDLRFDFGAVEALEREGCNLFDGIAPEEFRKPSVLVRLVWAGQLHARPALTLDEARAELARRRPVDVLAAVADAVRRDVGDEPDDEEAPDDAPPIEAETHAAPATDAGAGVAAARH